MHPLLQSLRGMPDILPEAALQWAQVESIWRSLSASYGYSEIRLPLLESTQLFKRSIGDATDIIEKEMFSLDTKDGERISLRPEGTASCVRAGLEHRLFYHQTPRLWYMGPMFRYERPQKGRYRQFHQIGVETFGIEDPAIEVEHILMMYRFWQALKIEGAVTLVVNTLGSADARAAYRAKLVDYFSRYYKDLDADSQRRLETNPLRILDSKNPTMQELIRQAPSGFEHLDTASKIHFDNFLQSLSDVGIVYTLDTRLVRGLDYYNRTVYEWRSDQLGAQNAIAGGGRYDKLVEHLGGTPTPAVGFSMGLERVFLLQKALVLQNTENTLADVYVVHTEAATSKALLVAEAVRDEVRGLRIMVQGGKASLKQQFKKADQSGARIALILAEDELKTACCSLKFLRESEPQRTIPYKDVVNFLNHYLKGS
jgi:histidyl-tRNA synthetase